MSSLDEGITHTMCGTNSCQRCHCHWCHFETECRLDRAEKENDHLRSERDEYRALLETLTAAGEELKRRCEGIWGTGQVVCVRDPGLEGGK